MFETALSSRFAEALAFAYSAHATQRRKGTDVPYLGHVLGVASLVIDHDGSEDEAIAGLLHDVPEDCGGRLELEKIRMHFGPAVAAIVEGCTDTFQAPMPPWEARKQTYVAHLAVASPSICLVTAADKLHNARAILNDHKNVGDALWERFSAGDTGKVLWYYAACVEVLRGRAPVRLWEDLRDTVQEIRRRVVGRGQP